MDDLIEAEREQSEQRILTDVYHLAGVRFAKLSSVAFDSFGTELVRKMLELFKGWIGRVPDADFRSELYHMFGRTDLGGEYLADIIEWWRKEREDPFSALTSLFIRYLDAEHAVEVWTVAKGRSYPGLSRLLTKLTEYSSIRVEVLDRICSDIEAQKIRVGDLENYAKLIHFDCIRKTLNALSQEAKERSVKEYAARAINKIGSMPSWLQKTSDNPHNEVWSGEIELTRLDADLSKKLRQFSVKAPRFGNRLFFLETVDRQQWFYGDLLSVSGTQSFRLWFRAEDTDVVHVVLSAYS